MDTKTNHFEQLIRKYLDNSCTRQELDELVQWASDNPKELRARLEVFWNDIPQQGTQRDGLFDEMMKQAGEWEAEDESQGKVIPVSRQIRHRGRWLRIAAAVLVVLAGTALWYQLSRKKSADLMESAQNIQKPADIAPGGNKAILTLADGTKIILDSANNGAITKQGNITVIKLNDGEIAYKSSILNLQSSMVSYNTISTPRGGQYQLVLADGSKVWLNAESSLRFPTAFAGNERNVELTGEGYFEVAHNAAKPFRVGVNDMTVEVLGTHFNINAYSDEDAVKTTLLQGSVRVSEGKESVKIKPGQQARLETGNNKLQTINNVNVDEVVAWKNGRFYFSDADITTVMHQLARWYNFKVEFKGEITDRFHIEMTRNTNLSNVFKILEGTGGVHFKIEQNKVYVVP